MPNPAEINRSIENLSTPEIRSVVPRSLFLATMVLFLASLIVNIFLLTKPSIRLPSAVITSTPDNESTIPNPTIPTDTATNSPLTPTTKSNMPAVIPITSEVTLSIPNVNIIKQPADGTPVWSPKIVDGRAYIITVNNTTYLLGTTAAGLCPWDSENPEFVDETNCGYTDVILKNSSVNIPTFRIWKDNRGVFALNPHSMTVNGKYIDFFVIRKDSPTASFSGTEIAMWENMLLEGLR